MSPASLTGWRRGAILAAMAACAAAPAATASEGFHSPAPGEALAPGSIVEIRWTSLCDEPRDREIDEAEVVLSLDGGRTFPVRITPELRPCVSKFLWKVPSLPAEHARLALRAGSEERDHTEKLEVLSADFRILPDPDGRVEQLRRRASEWWTPSAPAVLCAEDLLEKTMSPVGDGIGRSEGLPEASAPPTAPSATRPKRGAARAAGVSLVTWSIAPRAGGGATGAPIPLRL